LDGERWNDGGGMGASKKPEVKHYFHISMMEDYPRNERKIARECFSMRKNEQSCAF